MLELLVLRVAESVLSFVVLNLSQVAWRLDIRLSWLIVIELIFVSTGRRVKISCKFMIFFSQLFNLSL